MDGKESREDEHNRFQRIFNKIDVNRDGKITVEELHLMMKNEGYSYSMEDIKQIIASVDGNNDGRIVFSEFSFFMRKIKSGAVAMVETEKSDPVKDNELYQAFKLFDADGDGFVSLEEFTRAMETLELETETLKIKNLFQELDGNNDDKVDFYEFVRLFQR